MFAVTAGTALLLVTSHGPVAAALTSTTEQHSSGYVTVGDGTGVSPAAPAHLLRRNERVRVELPDVPDGATQAGDARLEIEYGHRRRVVDGDEFAVYATGRYLLAVIATRTWTVGVDTVTQRATWTVKVRVR